MKKIHHFRLIFGGATALAAIAFLAISHSASASLADLLGPADDYAILGIGNEGGATIHLSSGPLQIDGNVGVGNNSQLNFDGGGIINGQVNYASSATLNTGGNTITGGTQLLNFGPIEQDVQNVVNFAGSLTPTQSFSSITSPMTLQSTASVNVISIAGDIHLSGGNLVLNGGPSAEFIIQVKGTMELSGNTNIVLSGGLTQNNVLWDFIGPGSQFQTSGKSETAGIFLAPDRVININGGIQNSEFISGETLSFQSNPVVVQPIPEANTGLGLIPFALGMLAIASRKFLGTQALQNEEVLAGSKS